MEKLKQEYIEYFNSADSLCHSSRANWKDMFMEHAPMYYVTSKKSCYDVSYNSELFEDNMEFISDVIRRKYLYHGPDNRIIFNEFNGNLDRDYAVKNGQCKSFGIRYDRRARQDMLGLLKHMHIYTQGWFHVDASDEEAYLEASLSDRVSRYITCSPVWFEELSYKEEPKIRECDYLNPRHNLKQSIIKTIKDVLTSQWSMFYKFKLVNDLVHSLILIHENAYLMFPNLYEPEYKKFFLEKYPERYGYDYTIGEVKDPVYFELRMCYHPAIYHATDDLLEDCKLYKIVELLDPYITPELKYRLRNPSRVMCPEDFLTKGQADPIKPLLDVPFLIPEDRLEFGKALFNVLKTIGVKSYLDCDFNKFNESYPKELCQEILSQEREVPKEFLTKLLAKEREIVKFFMGERLREFERIKFKH